MKKIVKDYSYRERLEKLILMTRIMRGDLTETLKIRGAYDKFPDFFGTGI